VVQPSIENAPPSASVASLSVLIGIVTSLRICVAGVQAPRLAAEPALLVGDVDADQAFERKIIHRAGIFHTQFPLTVEKLEV
jgi:hypothetical protein